MVAAALAVSAGVCLFLVMDGAGSPCAKVRAGKAALKDSPSCVRECAVDGGDCPYNARARAPDQK